MAGALRTIIYSHMFDMDALIALSTTVAYAFSVTSYALWYHGKPLDTEFFFETSCLLVTLILMGRTISEIARFRAAQSVSCSLVNISVLSQTAFSHLSK